MAEGRLYRVTYITKYTVFPINIVNNNNYYCYYYCCYFYTAITTITGYVETPTPPPSLRLLLCTHDEADIEGLGNV